MQIVVTPISTKPGGTDVSRVWIDVAGNGTQDSYKIKPGPEAHALALQMLQAASTLLRADNAGFDLSNELEITIAQLEMLIEEACDG